MLHARLSRQKLVVHGEAARAGPYQAEIDLTFTSATVLDNGSIAVAVAVRGRSTGPISRLDLSRLTGAGAQVVDDGNVGVGVLGSGGDDRFRLYGSGADRVVAGGGNDEAWGFGGDDVMGGGAGDDRLAGGDGDDRLTGGSGADIIDGGAGADVAALSGAYAEYRVEIVAGNYRVTDLRAGQPDGIDLLANVERLRFADRTVSLAAVPTGLDAKLVAQTLTVAGTPVWPFGRPVRVVLGTDDALVLDTDAIGTIVSVAGAQSGAITTLDLTGLAVAGAQVTGLNPGSLAVLGSAQADTITLTGAGALVVDAGDGDDIVTAGSGFDILSGGDGVDTLSGGDGDDVLIGGARVDLLDGGAGDDIAVYSGNRADYRIEAVAGTYRVLDLRADSPDDMDLIGNVEHLRFADGTIDLVSPPTGLTATVDGGRLTVRGDASILGADPVSIRFGYGGTLVLDNNATHNRVVIGGNTADPITALDIGRLRVSGAHVSAFSELGVTIGGSRLSDEIHSNGPGNDALKGRAGADSIFSDNGRDRLWGGAGDDRLFGGEGNDKLTGGAGNDLIDGGEGNDTAIYSGAFADYRLEIVDGIYRLTDLRAGSPQGVDLLGNVEHLRFADQIVDLAPI